MVSQVFLIAALCACFVGLVMTSTLSYENPVQVNFQSKNKRMKLAVNFEAYTPQGLRATVSKLDGIDFFGFYAQVNLPIRTREQGNLTWEVLTPETEVITNYFPDDQLLTGDVINFWIRIQKNGYSMMSDVHAFIITDLQPLPSTLLTDSRPIVQGNHEAPRASTTRRPPHTTTYPPPPREAPPVAQAEPVADGANLECPCSEETLNDVWTKLNVTKQKLQALEEIVDPLKNKLGSLTEAVDELIKSVDIGTELLLTGTLPGRSNPVEDVRHLLIEKLKLSDLSSSILQAEYTDNGIRFEVATSIDKLRILKRAKDTLVKVPYQIVDLKGQPILDVRSEK